MISTGTELFKSKVLSQEQKVDLKILYRNFSWPYAQAIPDSLLYWSFQKVVIEAAAEVVLWKKCSEAVLESLFLYSCRLSAHLKNICDQEHHQDHHQEHHQEQLHLFNNYICPVMFLVILFNPFLANVPILYPRKTPENQLFSVAFMVHEMAKFARNGLKGCCSG